jgi:hypothetical protein
MIGFAAEKVMALEMAAAAGVGYGSARFVLPSGRRIVSAFSRASIQGTH